MKNSLRPFLMCAGLLVAATSDCFGGEPLRVLTTALPGLGRPATAAGDTFLIQLGTDGRFVLMASSADNLATVQSNLPPRRFTPAPLNLYLRDRASNVTTLVTVDARNVSGANRDVQYGAVSTNGSRVVFETEADNLVVNDTNGSTDVFVRDLVAGETILVSQGTNGTVANGPSYSPAMTPDGHRIAFVSEATNLVPGDTNGIPDIFVRDLENNTTTLVTVKARSSGSASTPVGSSEAPLISDDGRYIAFYSTATNLVPGVPTVSGTTRYGDIYVRDMLQGITIWASRGARAAVNPPSGTGQAFSFNHRMSSDGQTVYFQAAKANTSTGAVLRFVTATETTEVLHTNTPSVTEQYEQANDLVITPDGGKVVFSAFTNAPTGKEQCLLVWNAVTRQFQNASLNIDAENSSDATHELPAIDATGRFVIFFSDASDLVTNEVSYGFHVYLRDLELNQTWLVNQGPDGNSTGSSPFGCAISDDGRFIGYDTWEKLSPGDKNFSFDAVIKSSPSGAPEVVSVPHPDLWSITGSGASSIGRKAIGGNSTLFLSEAEDLVVSDTNVLRDIYIRDLTTGEIKLVSVSTNGSQLTSNSGDGQLSADGRWMAFATAANSLTPNDTNGAADVFLKDLQTGDIRLVSAPAYGGTVGNGASTTPELQADGTHVLFISNARNLDPAVGGFNSQLYIRDMKIAKSSRLSNLGVFGSYGFSADGRYAVYVLNETVPGAYILDTQQNIRVHTNRAAGLTLASLNPNGRLMAYWAGSGLSLLGVEDWAAKTNSFIFSTTGAVTPDSALEFSSDGRWLAFMVTNQIYVHDLLAGTNTLITRGYMGGAGNGKSEAPVFSPDGRFVAFASLATNLLPQDTNDFRDVYVCDLRSGSLTLVSASYLTGGGGASLSGAPTFTPDGLGLLFNSWAGDLVPHDFNNASDIFLYDMTELIGTFRITYEQGNGGLLLKWATKPGWSYSVQQTDSLLAPNWQAAPGTPILNGNSASWASPEASGVQRYFRVLGH